MKPGWEIGLNWMRGNKKEPIQHEKFCWFWWWGSCSCADKASKKLKPKAKISQRMGELLCVRRHPNHDRYMIKSFGAAAYQTKQEAIDALCELLAENPFLDTDWRR